MAVGDWVPCVRYGTQVSAALNTDLGVLEAQTILCAVGNSTLGGFGEVGTVETEAEVMTKRVVGWVTFRGALEQAGTLIVHERIRVGLLDDVGDLSFYADDLSDATMANEPFLWERVAQIEVAAPLTPFIWPQPDVGHPGWSYIDVKVARRLRRQDVLVYSIQANFITADEFEVTDVFTVFPFLRTWARALS